MMSWVWTVLAGVLGAVGGGAGMFLISNIWVKWFRISSFEGKAGFFVIGMALLGVIGGVVAGVVGARLGYSYWAPVWYGQVLGGMGLVTVLLLGVLGVSYTKVDHVPELGGRGLVVAWELRLPAEGAEGADPYLPKGDPKDWPEGELKLQMVNVVGERTRGYQDAVFEREKFRKEEGQWVLPARVALWTSKGKFCVNLTMGGRDDGFWPALTASGHGEGWFEWQPWCRTNKSLEKPSDGAAVMYRFRLERGEGAAGGD